jgi:hypothetical protein
MREAVEVLEMAAYIAVLPLKGRLMWHVYILYSYQIIFDKEGCFTTRYANGT